MGALYELQRRGALDGVREVVGASIGSCLGAAVVAGADMRSLLKRIIACDRTDFFRVDLDTLFVSSAGFGLDSGAGLDALIDVFVDRSVTFAQLFAQTGRKLVVCVTCLTTGTQERCSVDTTPGMRVALAIKMSCSVPLAFRSVVHCGKEYVDGGVTDNFPLDHFADAPDHPRVLGIRTTSRRGDGGATGLVGYIARLLCTSVGYHEDQQQQRAHRQRVQVIAIASPYASMHVSLDSRALFDLFVDGQKAVHAFYKKQV